MCHWWLWRCIVGLWLALPEVLSVEPAQGPLWATEVWVRGIHPCLGGKTSTGVVQLDLQCIYHSYVLGVRCRKSEGLHVHMHHI
jgi:hypothetical protein